MVYGIWIRNRGDGKRTLTIGEAEQLSEERFSICSFAYEMLYRNVLATSYYESDIVVDTRLLVIR